MNTRQALILCILVTSLLLTFPSVNAAQTTRIYELIHPINALAGGATPLPISAIVFYNNTVAGETLVIGLLDADKTPQLPVPGVVTSSPDPCANQPSFPADCRIKTKSGSGAEHLEFKIGGKIFGGKSALGPWNLNMTTLLLDSSGNLIPKSVSTILFAIQLTPATLQVIVPVNVAVSIDGVKLPPGPTQVPVVLGDHNMTVPPIAQIDTTTRKVFDHWSDDGSTNPNRTILITKDTNVEAVYITQHLLTIEGPQLTSEGAGWYDENAVATFSVQSVESMSGPLGLLGGKLKFQGWYENGTLLTDQTTGNIKMNTPHTINANWQTDYSLPAATLLGIVILLAFAYLVAKRRRGTRKRTASKRRSR